MKRFWAIILSFPNDPDQPPAALSKPPFLLLCVMGLIEVALFMIVNCGYEFLKHTVGVQGTQYVIAASVIGAGIAAYFFRKTSQYIYRLVEVLFAAIAAIRISLRLQPQQILFTEWVALVGCAYVVARGVSNMSEARRIGRNPMKGTSEAP